MTRARAKIFRRLRERHSYVNVDANARHAETTRRRDVIFVRTSEFEDTVRRSLEKHRTFRIFLPLELHCMRVLGRFRKKSGACRDSNVATSRYEKHWHVSAYCRRKHGAREKSAMPFVDKHRDSLVDIVLCSLVLRDKLVSTVYVQRFLYFIPRSFFLARVFQRPVS